MDEGINISIEEAGGITPPKTFSDDQFIISGSTVSCGFKKISTIIEKLKKDETRTYDCGGLPVELTLPKESYSYWEHKSKDYFQDVINYTYIEGNGEIGEFFGHMRIACDMIEDPV